MLADVHAPAVLAGATLAVMLADAGTPRSPCRCSSGGYAASRRCWVLAWAPAAVVLADAGAPAVLADAPAVVMLADAGDPAVLA